MVFVGSHEHSHLLSRFMRTVTNILDHGYFSARCLKNKGDNLSISIKPKCCILGEQIYMEAQGAPKMQSFSGK